MTSTTTTNNNSSSDQFKTDYPSNDVPMFTPEEEKLLGFDRETEGLGFMQRRRLQERLRWKKYWEIRDKETEGSMANRLRYFGQRCIDAPVTWFRDKIVDSLNDRYRMPYYHRRLDRVPEIDQCGAYDQVCLWEANEQYRLDKQVDAYIMQILRLRLQRCLAYHDRKFIWKCSGVMNEYLENDENFFVKYGEIGAETDVVDAYMKQKHRLIWERRHPQIMAERKRRMEDHRKAMEEGKYDFRFWRREGSHHVKQDLMPGNIYGVHWKTDKFVFESDQPISKDWRYYKKLATNVDFDVRNYPPWLNESTRKAEELMAQKKAADENGRGRGEGEE